MSYHPYYPERIMRVDALFSLHYFNFQQGYVFPGERHDFWELVYADIGGARFQETEGVGSRIREKAFMEQFVGKTPPLSLGDGIDAASGATVSSQAAVDAVNAAAAFLAQ